MTDAQEAWDDFKKGLRVNKAYPNQVSDSDKLDSILAEQHDIETSIEQLKDDISLMDADDDVDNMSDLEGEEGTEELIMPEDEEGLCEFDEESGHILNGYDSSEEEQDGFYIYRTN